MKKYRFGRAFIDQVAKHKFTYGHFQRSKEDDGWKETFLYGWDKNPPQKLLSSSKKLALLIGFVLIFFVLFLRLFHLQIVQGSSNRELADSNRIQIKIIHAPRGVIYDRNSQILAQNEPGFRLIYPDSSSSAKPQIITRDDALKMEIENNPKAKFLEIDTIRAYPYKEKTAHILGYIGETTSDELKDPDFKNYRLGDVVGRSGIEQIYEKTLKGVDGGEVIEVDAAGNKIRTINRIDATSGRNIYLTIDADLQQAAYNLLAYGIKKSNVCCGALVAEDPSSGQILALVSYPSFDPTNISQALSSPNFPMLNRVIAGTYPPGSTFKIASALAGLSSGKISASTQFEDTGVLELGPYKFANWYFSEYGKKEEGGIDIIRALKRSNDIYFYQLGQLTGEKSIGIVANKLGLGRKLGIDLPGEVAGLIPDDSYKFKNFGEHWYPGDTLHMAIGQGFVLVTPLQISYLTSQIADNGHQYPPHLVSKITSHDQKSVKEIKFDSTSAGFKQTDINLVKKGLSEVPKYGGTAWPFFNFPIQTAGKTGSAEFGSSNNSIYKTHAWYTSYAPEDNPQIELTVLVEGGGEGSTVAGPISKELYRWYFSQDKTNLLKDLGEIATDSARRLGE